MKWDRSVLRGRPHLDQRQAERPPYEQLLEEIEATSYLAVGRKYGVSDNAVRKWVRFYERQIEREVAEGEGVEASEDVSPSAVVGRVREGA